MLFNISDDKIIVGRERVESVVDTYGESILFFERACRLQFRKNTGLQYEAGTQMYDGRRADTHTGVLFLKRACKL